jgi:ABC-type nickel/cobalt efflux system permease component RcnA
VPLRAQSQQVSFAPGAADLPTMKLAFVYRGPIAPAAARRLVYRDENFADRLGWREVVARAAPGLVLAASSVPERDRSRELSDYPADLLDNPPQVAEADMIVERAQLAAVVAPTGPRVAEAPVPPRSGGASPGSQADVSGASPGSRPDDSAARLVTLRPAPAPGPSAPAPRAPVATVAPAVSTAAPDSAISPAAPEPTAMGAADSGSPVSPRAGSPPGGSRNALTDLMTRRDMGMGLILFTLATAMILGAFHALEPGHGKTVVAAYLVGSRGTAWHAVLLGLAVTVSHTAGVFLLGAVTLYASRYVMPDRLYPWLGAVSGLAIAGVGLALLRQRWLGWPHSASHGHAHAQAQHSHSHEHDHEHPHGPHGEHVHHHQGRGHDHHHAPEGPVSVRSLVAMGLSGGIVPCPGALVVLLSALAWRRLGLGILLVVAFSVGLAAVLVAIGLLVVHARRLLGRMRGDGPLTTRWLPLASSVVITALGVVIAWQAVAGVSVMGFRLG